MEGLGGGWKSGVRQAYFQSELALGPERGHNVLDSFAAAYLHQHGDQHIQHGERLALP